MRLTRLSPLTISSRDRTTRVSRNKAGKTILVQHKPSDKIPLLKIKVRGSRHLLPIRRNGSSPPVAPNPRRRQIRARQQSFSGAQSQRRETRRNASSPPVGSNLRRRPTRRNAKARPARSKDNVKHRRAHNIGRAAVGQVARAEKVRVLDPVRPDSLAGAKLAEHTRVAHSAACRRALDRKASASAADRVCRA